MNILQFVHSRFMNETTQLNSLGRQSSVEKRFLTFVFNLLVENKTQKSILHG